MVIDELCVALYLFGDTSKSCYEKKSKKISETLNGDKRFKG